MSETNNISNTLVRDGISQQQRAVAALSPDYVKVDERGTADMLSLIYRYAKYVLYYDDRDYTPVQKADKPLMAKGDWQDFFRNNAPFQYAAVQQFAAGGLEQGYHEVRALTGKQIPADQLWPMFNRILKVVLQLNSWYTGLDESTGLHRMLGALITADFSKALHRLLAVANTFSTHENELAYQLEPLRNKSLFNGESPWGLSMDKLIAKDAYLSRLDAYPRRKREKTLQQLDELFSIFYKGILQVQQFALTDFAATLSGNEEHTPHLGLLYAFLKVFDGVKEGMNNITRQHLDFFYKEILQLKLRPHVPDHVHVVTELAKQVNTFLLNKDTGLKAGKDAKGKDVTFLLEEDVVFNKAKVTQLRTLFKDTLANLYMAPVANSADGAGDAFRNPESNSWPVLGAAAYINKNNPDGGPQYFPFANTGFIISTPALLLKEGKRNIFINITLGNTGADAPALTPLLTERVYLLEAATLEAMAAAKIDKTVIALIKDLLDDEPQQEKWLNDANFKDYTQIMDNDLANRIKKIAYVSLLEIAYTSERGWERVTLPVISFNSVTGELQVTITLEADAPAVLPADPKALKVSYPVKDPLLRILFNHRFRSQYLGSTPLPLYDLFSKATIQHLTVNVKAENVKGLLLGNDDGPVDGSKTFLPFSGVPKKDGSFFIGSDEAFRKRLTGLELKIEWEGLPADFQTHYQAYNPVPLIDNTSFAGTAEKLENGEWKPLLTTGNDFRLFTGQADSTLKQVNILSLDPLEALTTTAPAVVNIPPVNQPLPLLPYNNSSLNGFVRLRLNRHFYHQEYPVVLASQALRIHGLELTKLQDYAGNNTSGLFKKATDTKGFAVSANTSAWGIGATPTPVELQTLRTNTGNTLSAATTMLTEATNFRNYVVGAPGNVLGIPPAPYTPAIKSFSLSYTATAGEADIALLHLYPYEESNFKVIAPGAATPLMPSFADEGTLYIGISDVLPGSNVALLFRLAEFTANPDMPEAAVQWEYLVGNEWKILRKDMDVISDTTQGLLVSGIVTVSLPWDADVQHTILPAGYHWLKAASNKNTAAVCEAVLVAAQGVRAVFSNKENDLERLATALPPQSIGGLVTPQSAIKKITQDFPSFDGRREETDAQYYVRVSERLRHKGRAINVYDYEHMVLEAFPAIYKVKCIPHTKMIRDAEGKGTAVQLPGWVILAVIPEIAGYAAESKFRPKVSRIILKQVSEQLQRSTSSFARVQVINPDYQEIRFSGNIMYRKGKDEQYYGALLQKEVQEFLSPWVLTGSQDIYFGGTIMMSSVLQFIEKRDYVDYVTDFKMYEGEVSLKAITAATPWSVLIAGKQVYIPLQAECKGRSVPPGQAIR